MQMELLLLDRLGWSAACLTPHSFLLGMLDGVGFGLWAEELTKEVYTRASQTVRRMAAGPMAVHGRPSEVAAAACLFAMRTSPRFAAADLGRAWYRRAEHKLLAFCGDHHPQKGGAPLSSAKRARGPPGGPPPRPHARRRGGRARGGQHGRGGLPAARAPRGPQAGQPGEPARGGLRGGGRVRLLGGRQVRGGGTGGLRGGFRVRRGGRHGGRRGRRDAALVGLLGGAGAAGRLGARARELLRGVAARVPPGGGSGGGGGGGSTHTHTLARPRARPWKKGARHLIVVCGILHWEICLPCWSTALFGTACPRRGGTFIVGRARRRCYERARCHRRALAEPPQGWMDVYQFFSSFE